MSGFYPNKTSSVTIANGAAISGPVFCPGKLTAIQMPATWSAANLTFQGSPDGITYTDIKDSLGNEVVVVATAAELITIDRLESQTYIKIRSGTSGTPVNQGGDRILKIMEVRATLPR